MDRMILTNTAIMDAIQSGDLAIDPFDMQSLGVNSYDVKLGDKLLTYKLERTIVTVDDEKLAYLDSREDNATEEHFIGGRGFILQPGLLYLAKTLERVDSHNLIPMMDGRSSMGRLGISVHVTAGFGDLGYCGHWTLEVTCVHPVRIYSGMRIGQIWWVRPEGATTTRYAGKYQNAADVLASRAHEDWSER